MTIDRIHQEIKSRLNKLNSNHKKDLPAAYIDDAINKATDDFIEIFYSGNNSKQYRFGFEVTQQRVDMLQTLVVSNKSLTPAANAGTFLSFDLSSISPQYRHFLRGVAISPTCSQELVIHMVRHNDLDQKLLDVNTQPNLSWRRVLGVIRGNALDIYVKNFTLTNVKIDYIKQPAKVFISGYDSLEFTKGDTSAYKAADPKVQSEIHASYHDLLVDMTVQYLSGQLEDMNKFQLTRDQILSKI